MISDFPRFWWTVTLSLSAILAGHNLIWHDGSPEIATSPTSIRLIRDVLFFSAFAYSVARLRHQQRLSEMLPPAIPFVALVVAIAIPLIHCLDREVMTEINQGLRGPWLYAASIGVMGVIWDHPRDGKLWLTIAACFLTVSLACGVLWPEIFCPGGRFAGTLHTGNYAGAAILICLIWSTALLDKVSSALVVWWTMAATTAIVLSASVGALLLLPVTLAWAAWHLRHHAQVRRIIFVGLATSGVIALTLCLFARPMLVSKFRLLHALMSQNASNPDGVLAMASLPRSIDWTNPAAVEQERYRLRHTVSSFGLRLMDAQQLLTLASGRGYLTDAAWLLGRPGDKRQRFDSQWLTAMHNDGVVGLLALAIFWGWFLALAIRLALAHREGGDLPPDGEPLALAFCLACILVLFAAYPLQLRYPNNLLTAVITARILWLHRQQQRTIACREDSPA